MRIYLVQHGRPVSKEENPDRPLSDEGRAEVEKVARFLDKCGMRVETIFHSGKTRAEQTAEIMASSLNPSGKAVEKGGLSPLDDVKVTSKEIRGSEKDLMVVGHLPHLGRLAALLLTGDESRAVVAFQQGGVVCLEADETREKWMVAWMLVPEIIPP